MTEPLTTFADLDRQVLWHQMVQHSTHADKPPKRMTRAQGCYVYDDQGTAYLDALSGLWCVNVGYGRHELAAAAYSQLLELSYYPLTQSHTPAVTLAHQLIELLGYDGKVFFACTGSEANEVAFKMARQYQKQVGDGWRYKIIARYRAYHGTTMGALSATAQAERRMSYEPLVPGFLHVQPPYCYRCPFGQEYGSCQLECAQAIESMIVHEGSQTVAAVIVEPIISGGGVIVPPDEYLPLVRQICDRHEVLLIFDEVVSGFGRTGAMFGHQHWGVTPDIITLAKGITSGYLPLAATVATQAVFEAFLDEPGTLSHFRHISTYGGHPAATAVANANIQILHEEDLVERAAAIGMYLMAGLQRLAAHPWVGDIRGKGLLLGVELVSDRQLKTPLGEAQMIAIVGFCAQAGILIGRNGNTIPGFSNVLILAPPLILSEEEADQMIKVLEDALEACL